MNKGFINYVKDILDPFGPVTTRAMFGGYGVYKDGVMMGLIAGNELYFKADTESRQYFQSFGSEPFTYKTGDKVVTMSYWKVLPEIMDQEELLGKWVELAFQTAVNANKKRKRK